MELKSTELFEAVKNEYPELSASEVIAFVQAEYLAHIAENTDRSISNYNTDMVQPIQSYNVKR